jgi:hypothetical protein
MKFELFHTDNKKRHDGEEEKKKTKIISHMMHIYEFSRVSLDSATLGVSLNMGRLSA